VVLSAQTTTEFGKYMFLLSSGYVMEGVVNKLIIYSRPIKD